MHPTAKKFLQIAIYGFALVGIAVSLVWASLYLMLPDVKSVSRKKIGETASADGIFLATASKLRSNVGGQEFCRLQVNVIDKSPFQGMNPPTFLVLEAQCDTLNFDHLPLPIQWVETRTLLIKISQLSGVMNFGASPGNKQFDVRFSLAP